MKAEIYLNCGEELKVVKEIATVSKGEDFSIWITELDDKKIEGIKVSPYYLNTSFFRKDGWQIMFRKEIGNEAFLIIEAFLMTKSGRDLVSDKYLSKGMKWKDKKDHYEFPEDAIRIPIFAKFQLNSE